MCACPGDCEGGPECLDDEGGPLPVRDTRPFAVCAPGMRPLAELALVLHGEPPMEVREHPWLEGLGGVYVITPPDLADFMPSSVIALESPPSSVLWAREFARAFVTPPMPFVFGSVV